MPPVECFPSLFKRHQQFLHRLLACVGAKIACGLLGETVCFNCIQLSESYDPELAVRVEGELAPVAIAIGLVAVSTLRRALDAYCVQGTELDHPQRELFHGAAVCTLCRARAGSLERYC